MTDASRIDRIEERIAKLEAGLEEIRDALASMARPASRGYQPAPEPVMRPEPPPPAADREPWLRRPADLERWLGQNALLVVGVLALVAAVGFTLKYAFDQGWISPAARVAAGLVAGAATAGYGERLLRLGVRRYGAALQGGGAAIAYLSIWAAAGPYQFVPAGMGIAALAAISGLVLLSALRNSEEYLAGLGAAGAYCAPLLLGHAPGAGNVLLAYSITVSVAAAGVAFLRRWRGTYLVVALGFFLLAIVAEEPDRAFWGAYVAVGGGFLVWGAQSLGWKAHAVLAWFLAWAGLLAATSWIGGWRAWVFVVAPAALVAPVWLEAYRARDGHSVPDWDDLEDVARAVLFYGTAVLWTEVVQMSLPGSAAAYPLIAAAVVAALYLLPAFQRSHAAFQLAGIGVLALGIVAQWDGLPVAAVLVVPAIVSAIGTRSGPLAENRWLGPALMAMAAYTLFEVEATRPDAYPALTGAWAWTLYLVVIAALAIAGPLWKPTEGDWERPGGFPLRTATWLLAAVVALAGGTAEIPAFVAQRGGSDFAAGLAVSAYWLVLAGGLLAYGFWKESRAVRITGLVVGALAVGKVLFVDLAELRALYRVGSLALLAVIALLGARAYYKKE